MRLKILLIISCFGQLAYCSANIGHFSLYGRANYQTLSLPVSEDLFFMSYAQDYNNFHMNIYNDTFNKEKLNTLLSEIEWIEADGENFDIVIALKIYFIGEGNHFLFLSSNNIMLFKGKYYEIDPELKEFILTLFPSEFKKNISFLR